MGLVSVHPLSKAPPLPGLMMPADPGGTAPLRAADADVDTLRTSGDLTRFTRARQGGGPAGYAGHLRELL
jgi:hypothetical protein